MTERFARWISIVAHPFVMVALLIAAPRAGKSGSLRDLLLIAGAILLPLALLMTAQVRRRRWANVDASNPQERPILFAVAIGGAALTLVYLLLTDPESRLIGGIVISALFLALAALLTRWVKLSLHVAFATLTAAVLTLIGSPVGWYVAAVIPLLMWSRMKMGRHRPHELAVGFVLGAAAGFAMVYV
jgi:hypothetical protein